MGVGTAEKEKRDQAEVPIIEAVESLKLELGTFKAQNQEYATAMLESQRALSQLKRDIESAARELPELEAQKKLAVQARNFDEAQRVSTAIKALEAAKEANEAKKVVVETEIAAKQEANAETNRELQKLEEAVDEQAKKNDARRQQQLLQAATEYMKKTSAPKAKACACRGATQDMQVPADLRRGFSLNFLS